jgi:hypothetical protein
MGDDGGPADWVNGPMKPRQVRHYAACLYAAALLVPLAQQRGPDGPLMAYLISSEPGRRLALARSQQERMQLTRMLLDEALVLCRDDEPLLDLTASVYDALDTLAEELPDLTSQTRQVLARINRALAMANQPRP